MVNLLKKSLSLILCVMMMLSLCMTCFAEGESFTVDEDLSEEEREMWEEWASEEEPVDMSVQAGSIPLTPEEEALLDEIGIDLDESFHVDEVSLDDLGINEDLPDTVFNILLLGVDNRSTELQRGRTDAIILCSINLKTGDIKLTSFARDTAIPIPGHKTTRINAAYAYGGAELVMKTINEHFQLNVNRYVLVNIHGLAAVIDSLGGIDIEMTSKEAGRINFELRKEPMDDVKREKVPAIDGVQHLDGMQAVTFARIRGIDSDLERTRRQRQLLETLFAKVMQDMSLEKLLTLISTALPYVDTNLTMDELLVLGNAVITGSPAEKLQSGGQLFEQMRIPMDKKYGWKDFGGYALLYMNEKNLKYTIDSLHEFIYGVSYYKEP
ncbi:MAG: LytR family transcriptional regulator [Clostridiales bacterium]|nr:LytR family transcriptional regulator [Clostridiales bacterium]